MKALFFVEGFTDIRFVIGLSRVCDLTIAIPSRQYVESGLKQRVTESGAIVVVDEIRGGRIAFQARSLGYLWSRVRKFDVILSQEVLRGSLNATVIGRLRGVPVVTYMGIAPVEYFRCRRKRGQIGLVKAVLGEAVIRALMWINGQLATTCLCMGPYLREVASHYCADSRVGLYYGVDTEYFRPAENKERTLLRETLNLPADKFLIILSSRISHEKDPETVLMATAGARAHGLDAMLINVGGGYREFLTLARKLDLPDAETWVVGRPAVHPMRELADYYRAADVLAQASLAEGAGMSPLEALACGTPAVCTAVGGMAQILLGHSRLIPKGNADAMAEQFLWIARNTEEARAEALAGRDYVVREWSRHKAFNDLSKLLHEAAGKPAVSETVIAVPPFLLERSKNSKAAHDNLYSPRSPRV